MSSRIKTPLVLLLILTVAIFFRFSNASVRYGIGDDSSRDAFVAYQGAKDLQFPLTGPFSSLGQFTFGPWYYWQLIVFTRLTHHSFAPWIYLALASTAFVFVMYATATQLMAPTAGLIVAILVSLSPPQISTAKGLTNPNLISLFAGLSVLLFLKLTTSNRSSWWWFLWGLVLGIGINIHYQMAGLVLFLPLVLFTQKKPLRLLLWTCVGIGVTLVPMLLFDANNHWFLLRHMTEYYLRGKNAYYIPYRWLWYLRDFWPQFWAHTVGLPKVTGIPLLAVVAGTFLLALRKKQLAKPWILLLIVFGINFLALRYYWGERFFGYLQFLHPFIFLFTGFVLWKLLSFSRLLGMLATAGLIIAILPASIRELPADYPNLMARKDLALVKQVLPNQQIRIYSCKRRGFSRTIALAYLLHIEKRLTDQGGTALGYWDADCGYPATASVNPYSQTPVINQLESYYPNLPSSALIKLTHATASALMQAGWGDPITPKGMFDATVRWWFREQP